MNLLVCFNPIVLLNTSLCVIIAEFVKYFVYLAPKDYLANTGSNPQTVFCLCHEKDQERRAAKTKEHFVSSGLTSESVLRTQMSNITIHANT